MNAPQANSQQVLLRRDGNEVDVVGHEAVNEHCDVCENRLLAQEIKTNRTIGFGRKHKSARCSALSDVVDRAGRNASDHTGHSEDGVPGKAPHSCGKSSRDGSGFPLFTLFKH